MRKRNAMRNVLYFALCITLCAAFGCDEPKEEPSTPDPPAAPTNPTNPTKPTEPDEPTLPPAVPSDGEEHTVTLKSVDLNNGKVILKWESYDSSSSSPTWWKTTTGTTTLLGINATATVGTLSNAIFEEIEIGGNTPIIIFGEQGYASSGFAKSVGNVVIQELLLYEGLAVVDNAESNTLANRTDKDKISFQTYTAWKALEVHTPPAGDGSDTLNN